MLEKQPTSVFRLTRLHDHLPYGSIAHSWLRAKGDDNVPMSMTIKDTMRPLSALIRDTWPATLENT